VRERDKGRGREVSKTIRGDKARIQEENWKDEEDIF